jgi:shikimate dehydrogenase
MNIYPNKLTKLCISVSKKPGTSGSKFHNAGYKLLNLNYLYVPFKFDNLDNLKIVLNKFNIRGCSVSMPFKEKIIKFLDIKDLSTIKTNAANTLVCKNGIIKGYNTDYYATKVMINKINLKKEDTILLLGNGGVSKTIYEYIKKIKVKNIYLCARNNSKFKNWKMTKNSIILNWQKRNKLSFSLLINATPIGMNNKLIPIDLKKINRFKSVLDLVINSKSSFKKIAQKNEVKFYDGLEFSFYQACKQFEIYTNRKINKNLKKKILGYKF